MRESKERLLWLLLIGIWAFNKMDFFLTLEALEKGFVEANPLVDSMIGTHEFPLVKLVLIPLVLFLIWRLRHKIGERLLVYVWVPFISYFSLMVYFRMIIFR